MSVVPHTSFFLRSLPRLSILSSEYNVRDPTGDGYVYRVLILLLGYTCGLSGLYRSRGSGPDSCNPKSLL